MWLPTLLLAQLLVSPAEPLPTEPPKAAPIERKRLTETPEALFAALNSGDKQRVKAALEDIGLSEWLAYLDDIGLHAVNLDSDPEKERIITLPNVIAVMKRDGGEWWSLGTFICCGTQGLDVRAFAEWRELVGTGTRDILVHQTSIGGNGGAGETRLKAFRIWRGHLYPVFDIVESAHYWLSAESTRISYPQNGRIVIRRDFTGPKPRKSVCTAMQWNVAAFAFQPSPATNDDCRRMP